MSLLMTISQKLDDGYLVRKNSRGVQVKTPYLYPTGDPVIIDVGVFDKAMWVTDSQRTMKMLQKANINKKNIMEDWWLYKKVYEGKFSVGFADELRSVTSIEHIDRDISTISIVCASFALLSYTWNKGKRTKPVVEFKQLSIVENILSDVMKSVVRGVVKHMLKLNSERFSNEIVNRIVDSTYHHITSEIMDEILLGE